MHYTRRVHLVDRSDANELWWLGCIHIDYSAYMTIFHVEILHCNNVRFYSIHTQPDSLFLQQSKMSYGSKQIAWISFSLKCENKFTNLTFLLSNCNNCINVYLFHMQVSVINFCSASKTHFRMFRFDALIKCFCVCAFFAKL